MKVFYISLHSTYLSMTIVIASHVNVKDILSYYSFPCFLRLWDQQVSPTDVSWLCTISLFQHLRSPWLLPLFSSKLNIMCSIPPPVLKFQRVWESQTHYYCSFWSFFIKALFFVIESLWFSPFFRFLSFSDNSEEHNCLSLSLHRYFSGIVCASIWRYERWISARFVPILQLKKKRKITVTLH